MKNKVCDAKGALIYLAQSLGVLALILSTVAVKASQQVSVKQPIPSQNSAGQKLSIIALAPHIVELLYDIGAGDQIIATSSYADYPQQAKSIPVVGDHSRLQIEKIVQLQPDLIIGWKSGTPLDDLERLQKYGLRVEFSDPKNLSDIATELRMLGKLTDRQIVAEHLATQYTQKLDALQKRYAQSSSISVFFEIWPSPLQTVSRNAWPQQQLSVCGAQNIINNAAEDYPSVSLEQVLTNKPQIIIQPRSQQNPGSAIYDWQKYPLIPAVKHQLILRPDADKMYRMTRRVIQAITSMCKQVDHARKKYIASE